MAIIAYAFFVFNARLELFIHLVHMIFYISFGLAQLNIQHVLEICNRFKETNEVGYFVDEIVVFWFCFYFAC